MAPGHSARSLTCDLCVCVCVCVLPRRACLNALQFVRQNTTRCAPFCLALPSLRLPFLFLRSLFFLLPLLALGRFMLCVVSLVVPRLTLQMLKNTSVAQKDTVLPRLTVRVSWSYSVYKLTKQIRQIESLAEGSTRSVCVRVRACVTHLDNSSSCP